MTDLRDRARDEADLRQRLTDLAATITTDTTYDHLQTRIATTPPPRGRRRLIDATPLRLGAAAAVIVVVAAAIVVSRHGDDDRVSTATTTTTTTSTTTTTTTPEETTTTAVPPPTGIPGAPSPIVRQDQVPLIDLPQVLDTLGFGSSADVTVGGDPMTAPPPPPPTAPDTTTIPGPVIVPHETSPDGNPIATDFLLNDEWEPMVTYHQEGDIYVVDLWTNRGPLGTLHLDRVEIPPRPGQNCLILGSTTTPLFNIEVEGSPPVELRLIAGVVTTKAPLLTMTNIPVGSSGPVTDQGFPITSIEAFPGLDIVLLMVPGEFLQLDAYDDAGNLHHTVTAADPDAFPDTC